LVTTLFDRFDDVRHAARVGADVHELIANMYPICRSITGEGVRRTLGILDNWITLKKFEVPTGTKVFDWEVPREWSIRDAYIADEAGRRLVDFRASNLHVVSYSTPVARVMSRSELAPHLYSIPDRPDWIPYRTSYYKEQWGFCLRHRDLELLGPGPFRVVIDSDLAPGTLTYAECTIPGATSAQAIVFAHTCHPSMANDSLSGVALAAALAREMLCSQPQLTWRFIFGPATIGSLVWLHRNESALGSLASGIVLGPLGDAGPLRYKRSRMGNSITDRAAQQVLASIQSTPLIRDFEPYGYDERQFCSPGFNLPVGRFTRSANGEYPEYHTSADDLSLVLPEKLAESFMVIGRTMAVIDANVRILNLSPKGEPQLGRRGLYGAMGGFAPERFQLALLWVLSMGDGTCDMIEIAARSGMPADLLSKALRALTDVGLVRTTSAHFNATRQGVP
jgi:aminopeptidase-like protein